MGKDTSIEYADSSGNLMMGCDGCELWNDATGVYTCYAGTATLKYGGGKGWPDKFENPVIFPERLKQILGWPDLRGLDRPLKPWLDGLPRVVFLNDMGDAHTKSLPVDWFKPYVEPLANSPHFYLSLTKNRQRMIQFWRALGFVPDNFILGVSVTGAPTLARASDLACFKIDCSPDPLKRPRIWISYEPALEWVNLEPIMEHARLEWLVIGGESDQESAARFTDPEVLYRTLEAAARWETPAFVKQLGAPLAALLRLNHPKGGDWSEWPNEFKVRQMPKMGKSSTMLF